MYGSRGYHRQKESTAPDAGDADCYMIHIPTALENQIRATIVNRRHLNNRFRIEDNHCIKLDGGSDISLFKHIQAFSVLRHERQFIPFRSHRERQQDTRDVWSGSCGTAVQVYMGTQSGDVHIITDALSKVVSKHGIRTVLQQSIHYPGGQSSSKLAIATA